MLGVMWSYGAVIGFEFIDTNFLGGGWILHLGIFKLIYMKLEEDE